MRVAGRSLRPASGSHKASGTQARWPETGPVSNGAYMFGLEGGGSRAGRTTSASLRRLGSAGNRRPPCAELSTRLSWSSCGGYLPRVLRPEPAHGIERSVELLEVRETQRRRDAGDLHARVLLRELA